MHCLYQILLEIMIIGSTAQWTMLMVVDMRGWLVTAILASMGFHCNES